MREERYLFGASGLLCWQRKLRRHLSRKQRNRITSNQKSRKGLLSGRPFGLLSFFFSDALLRGTFPTTTLACRTQSPSAEHLLHDRPGVQRRAIDIGNSIFLSLKTDARSVPARMIGSTPSHLQRERARLVSCKARYPIACCG